MTMGGQVNEWTWQTNPTQLILTLTDERVLMWRFSSAEGTTCDRPGMHVLGCGINNEVVSIDTSLH